MGSRRGAPLVAALVFAAGACTSDQDGSAADEPAASAPSIVENAGIVERGEWGQVFDDEHVVGTFAVREVGSNQTFVWDTDRVEQPRLPASTFKIVNSMIILQTGVVADVDEVVPWDGVEREIDAWNRDHSLRSGIEVSSVWTYQELARRVGEDRMAEWVDAAAYGNADIGGGIEQFWLTGDLRISPLEQLDFLERMVTGDLPFDPSVVADVREIIVREQGDGWTWSHKTGTVMAAPSPLGWLVGSTRYDGRSWVFAMNVDLASTEPETPVDPQARESLSRRLLEAVGALPAA